MDVPNAAWIHTGKRGRVILGRDEEKIMFAPNTMAAIMSKTTGGKRETVVGQQFGRLLLDVETRAEQHTTVQTPYLAAVVKGTRFETIVDGRTAGIRVERGSVEATDFGSRTQVDVRSGQSVAVNAGDSAPLSVKGPGEKATVRKAPAGMAVPQIAPPPANHSGQTAGGAAEAVSKAGNAFGATATPVCQRQRWQ